jgi:hypothetical protein
MTTTREYFQTFFTEKDLPTATWEFHTATDVHIISSADVIEILQQLPEDPGARKIADTLRVLDFRNGDILHYLQFLARGLIQTTYGTAQHAVTY